MANGKSILIEILAMSFTVSDIILAENTIEQDHGYEPIKSYVLTDGTYVKRVFSRCVMRSMLCDAFCNRFAYKEVRKKKNKKKKKRNTIAKKYADEIDATMMTLSQVGQ